MKKILLIIASIGLMNQASAQIRFRAGLEGGFNSTWFAQDDLANSHGPYSGGQIGIGGFLKFNKLIGISVGFVKNTIQVESIDKLAFSQATVKYLDIPLLFRLTTPGKKAAFYFEVGPQYSKLLNGGDRIYTKYSSYTTDQYYKSGALSWQIGLGLDVNAGDYITITTGIRAGLGLTDITTQIHYVDDYGSDSSVGFIPFNINFHVGVAYNLIGVVKK